MSTRSFVSAESLAVQCPGCGRAATAAAVRAPSGSLYAGRIDMASLAAHLDCDLFRLAAEFSRAAIALSRPSSVSAAAA
jgi:hypothetical protein